jgi:hypothetical protein
VATRLVNLVVDAADPAASARWWAEALGWPVTLALPDEVVVEPEPGGPGVPLVFVPVADPKTGPNRVHLDLASPSPAAQAALVERLTGLGATPPTSARARSPGRSWPTPTATSSAYCPRAD